MSLTRNAIIFTITLCGLHHLGTAADEEPSQEESLSVRRIATLFQEGNPATLRQQIQLFFKRYPDSSYTNQLTVMLGDLARKEEDYPTAIDHYGKVTDGVMKDEVISRLVDCLFKIEDFEGVILLLQPTLDTENGPAKQRLYLAEALYRLSTSLSSNEMLHDAEEIFSNLTATPYKTTALQRLAVIERTLGNNDRALALLRQLEHGEEGLTQEQAVVKIAILYQLGEYDKVLEEGLPLLDTLDNTSKPQIIYLLARSSLGKGDYATASGLLTPLFSQGTEDALSRLSADDQKGALLTLTAASSHLHNTATEDAWLERLEVSYPDDPVIARALLFSALANKQYHRTEKAEQLLLRILTEFQNSPSAPQAQYELATLLFQQKRWQECHDRLIVFLDAYPNSTLTEQATLLLPQASSNLLAMCESQGLPVTEVQELLATDLKRTLESVSSLAPEDVFSYSLALGKTLSMLERHDEVLALLPRLVSTSSGDKRAEVELLLALSYRDGKGDTMAFIEHAETALSLTSDADTALKLRLSLFNSYLAQAQRGRDNDTFAKAADHLYQAVLQDQKAVTRSQKRWLANYYYEQSTSIQRQHNPTAGKRAERLFAELFGNNTLPPQITDTHEIDIERDIIRWAEVNGILGDSNRQIAILENLTQQQAIQVTLPWQYKLDALEQLAQAQQEINDLEAATATLERLIRKTSRHPAAKARAALKLVQLTIQQTPPDERIANNPEVAIALGILRNLQNGKQLEQEPVHLEAAFEFAAILASLSPPKEQVATWLDLLIDLKQDFTSTATIAAQDYRAARKHNPDKEAMFQAYMMLADAHIARLEATLAQRRQSPIEQAVKEEAAHHLYSTLLRKSFAVSNYLIDQATSGLTALDDLNVQRRYQLDQIAGKPLTKDTEL